MLRPRTAALVQASQREGAEENKIPQKYTNWPNETACVTISYDNSNLPPDNLHLVCTLILQITKMGCCGNGHVLFRLLGEARKTPSKYLLRHTYSTFFYCVPPHPEITNLLTVGIFFLSFKNGFSLSHLHFYYVYYQFMQMDRKIHGNRKAMDTDCLSHVSALGLLSFTASPLLSSTALSANSPAPMYVSRP